MLLLTIETVTQDDAYTRNTNFIYDVYCSKSKNIENTMATPRFIIILQKNHVLLLQEFRTNKSLQ